MDNGVNKSIYSPSSGSGLSSSHFILWGGFNPAADSPLTRTDVKQGMMDPWPVLEKYWPGSADLLKSKDIAPKPRHFFPVVRIDQARQLLGWKPQITFTDYLRHLGWAGQGTV